MPTLEEIARAAGFAPSAEAASPPVPSTAYQASEVSSSTLVGSGREDSSFSEVGMMPKRKGVRFQIESHEAIVQQDMEILIWLTGIPLFAMFLKLFATVMGFRKDGSEEGTLTDTDSEVEEGSMASARIESNSTVAGRLQAEATRSPSSPPNGKSPFSSRKTSNGLLSRLEKIEEASAEESLGSEAQEEHLLRVPA